jgi:outer membrane protein assembly factor BamB
MINRIIKSLLVLFFGLLLVACDGLFDKDNTPEPTPLTNFKPLIKPRLAWSTRAGKGGSNEYLRLSPAISENAIYTASTNGVVTSINKTTGRTNWQINSGILVTTSPGVGDGLVVVGSRKGEIVALQQANGIVLWKTSIPCEILAQPALDHGLVIVKGIDGHVHALSFAHGHEKWSYQEVEPSLILRGASAPLIANRSVFVGFANGNLSKLSLTTGERLWTQPIAIAEGAFTIQRMIDIDADPVVYGEHIFAATYQGNIASLDWSTGRPLWSHKISSYTGMVAENSEIYITDAQGYVWAFDARSGQVLWQQKKLEARVLSAPAIIGSYVVVGDAEGYVHWLNKSDGSFAARTSVSGPVAGKPLTENNMTYILTNKGNLYAYRLY